MLFYYLLNKIGTNIYKQEKVNHTVNKPKAKILNNGNYGRNRNYSQNHSHTHNSNTNKTLENTMDILDKSVSVVQKTERAVGEIKPYMPFLVNLPTLIAVFKLMNTEEFQDTSDVKDSNKC